MTDDEKKQVQQSMANLARMAPELAAAKAKLYDQFKGTCKSCGAALWWATFRNGAKQSFMPMNQAPDPRGGFVLEIVEVIVAGKPDAELQVSAYLPLAHGPDKKRFASHFADCPNASQHRRSRK